MSKLGSQRAKESWRYTASPKRILCHGIKAGAHEDQVRMKTAGGGQQHLSTSCPECSIAISTRKRYVHGEASTRPFPNLIDCTRARVESCASTVNADEQHLAISPEDLLCALPVVHIPIENEHPAHDCGMN